MSMFEVVNGDYPHVFVAGSGIVFYVVLELGILSTRSNLRLKFCDFVLT